MDDQIKIQELKEKVKTFCETRDWDQFHSPKELAIALNMEASEVLAHFRFIADKDVQNRLKDRKKEISEELADVFWFLLRFCQMNNIDLSKELLNKLDKNEERFPMNKFKGSNKKYNEI